MSTCLGLICVCVCPRVGLGHFTHKFRHPGWGADWTSGEHVLMTGSYKVAKISRKIIAIPGLNLPRHLPHPIRITPPFSHLRSEEMTQDGVSTQAEQGLIAEICAYVKLISPSLPQLFSETEVQKNAWFE